MYFQEKIFLKRFLYLIILLNIFLYPLFAAITGITKEDVPAATFYPDDVNKLVFKINLTGTGTDTLKSIEIGNQGTADQSADIAQVKLWYQATGGTFDPGTATFIGVLPRTANKTWALSSINFTVAAGSSLYVSVDISSNPGNGKTIKISLAKNKLSIGSNTYPSSALTNANTQTISNPPKIKISYLSLMPEKVNAGQSNVLAGTYYFLNTGSVAVSITNIILRTINYSGEIPANSAISRIVLKSGISTYADVNTIPSSSQISIALSPGLSIPGGTEKSFDVYIYLLPGINTRDIGIRLLQGSDVTTNSEPMTKEAKTGYSFPMDTALALITLPVSSVNMSFSDIIPLFVTDSQAEIKTMVLTFSHPQSLTTYADCSIRGITLVAQSQTNPSLNCNDLFSKISIKDGVTNYADVIPSSATNQIFIPFSSYLNIAANTTRSVTITADLKSGLFDNNFYVYVSQAADIGAFDGSSGTTINAAGAFPMSSGLSMIQRQPSYLGIHHTNKMPSVVVAGQQYIYAEDFVLTHPNTGNYASIELKGVTINVEDNLGNTITPSNVISRVIIFDANNNTVANYSLIPLSGYKMFIDFSSSVVITPGASNTLKVFIDIPLNPSGSYVKLNLNSSLNINAVDGNSHIMPVSVQADAGDNFPMKTSAAQILNVATDVKVKHINTMPYSVNTGQENVVPFLLNFLNDSGGIVSIESIKLGFFDNAGNSVPTNSVINNIKIDNANNTATVYVDSAVTTNSAFLNVPLTSPILINYGIQNSVTVNVKVNIANPAANNNFKMSIITETFITAKDLGSGNTITVIANNDTFPMSSSVVNIEQRANTLNVFYDGTNSGSAQKGDANVPVMDVIFENPAPLGSSDILITGITLTVEDSFNNTIDASTAISKIVMQNKSTAQVYGQILSIPSSSKLFLEFANPITVTAAANLTCTVKVNIASFATASNFRINLASSENIGAVDENQLLYVTVTAKTPYSFPMRSDVINITSANKLTVLHINTMPETVSNGQKGIKPFILRFANASDAPVSIHGVTLTVEDISNSGIVPDTLIEKVYLIDSTGNTNISLLTIPSTGDKLYLTFTQDVTLTASTYKDVHLFIDLKENTFVANFQINLAAANYVEALPVTITVEADSQDAFPMRSSNALIQIKPVSGGISHSDVIPTTVSTGQTNIFAEILHIANYNVSGSADIQLTGITITVEDDTNTVIDPTTALKRIMIRDDNTIYAFFSTIPSNASPFYVPFIQPATLSVSRTADLKLYVDIVDTISTGNFQINIKIDSDVRFMDKNTSLTITAQAINGDSFPMRTSVVIIQEKATLCRVKTENLMPSAVNKGQQNIQCMKLSFSNEGSANGANILITRINLNTENSLNSGIIPKTAISHLYIKDASGTIYGDVLTIPDYGDSVSIALTTPITVQVGERKNVFVFVDINPDATANDFKLSLRSESGIIARDANSYDIINVSADVGYSFPMKTSAALIQNISQTLTIYHYGIITPTVNKGENNIAAIYFEFMNPNPSGYSDIIIKGITITVEDEAGNGIVPSSAITKLKLEGSSIYGEQNNIPASGSAVYLPLTITTLSIPPSSYIGATLYADISLTTEQLYLQFDLKQGIDCWAQDKNSETVIPVINAATGDSFPMRSGYTTIINPPGISVLHQDLAPYSATSEQNDIEVLKLKFTNTGSFAENITGITLTVKDSLGNNANADLIINNAKFVDNYGNTHNTSITVNNGFVYLDLSSLPFSIEPKNYNEGHIYIDLKNTTFTAQFYISLNSSSDIRTLSPVTAESPDTFPMNTKVILLQEKSVLVNLSTVDWMPPTVSTEQKDVFVMVLNFENNNPAGYSPVVIRGITVTVKDALSNTIAANKAISRLVFSDLTTEYLNTTDVPDGNTIGYDFTVPLTLTAGASKSIYCIVDIMGNTTAMANDFKISIENSLSIRADDYNSGAFITVTAKTGFSYPFESSAALIQKKASKLEISHLDKMPSFVSTGQENVNAMDLILTNAGDAKTSSIMVTRVNFYIQDPSDANINPLNVIRALTVTSEDGLTVFGSNTTLSSNKITVNLTAPIIVSTAAPVTVKVKVKIADTYINNSFKVNLETNTDIYALDANSFELVTVANKIPDTFPMKSGLTQIEEKVSNIGINNFVNLLSPAVTKGEKRVPLFTFRIEDALNSLTAKAEFQGITITVKNGAGSDLSANSVIEKLYVIDGNGLTIGSNTTGVSNKIALQFAPVYGIFPQSAHYITVYADVLATASAADFKVLLESSADISIKDENSQNEVPKTIVPSLPWQTGVCGVYNAPATDLFAWHSNYAPTQVGAGQTDVRFISLSLFNAGGPGTSDIIMEGVTITVSDALGNTLSPSDFINYIRISDFAEQSGYGWITTTSLTNAEPFYIDFLNPLQIEASNTKTVYFVADISSSTILANFKLGITLPENIITHNYPSGYVTITAKNNDAFPFNSILVSKIATTYILRVGHENIMPVSVAKGDKNVKAMELNFENKDAGQYIDIKGITLTVKDKQGNELQAAKVLDGIRMVDETGNTVYAQGTITNDGKIYLLISSFRVEKLSEKQMYVVLDIRNDASDSFYIELEKESDIATNPKCTVQPAAGDYFGNMKTEPVSIQEANLESSYHNFPNPFNPEKQVTTIEYYLEENATVSIKILTLDGRPVKTIIQDAAKLKGLHNEDEWDGLNEVKVKVKSGIYLCVLKVKYESGAEKKLIKKIAVLR